MSEIGAADEKRRFACTACGNCCDRGPEIELSEAADLAGTFIMSMIFRVHSIPLDQRSPQATKWWQDQNSRIPLKASFEEKRRHLSKFASRRRSERRNGREIFLTISAIVDDYGEGTCPALRDGKCEIYEYRPLTCRTVPLHYSRPPSALKSYFDRFTATNGYKCDTVGGPLILEGSTVLSPQLVQDRQRAVETAKGERSWKKGILALMDSPETASINGLPSYESILENSDKGYATLVPMIAAWRVALKMKEISAERFRAICGMQADLLKAQLAKQPATKGFEELLFLYQSATPTG